MKKVILIFLIIQSFVFAQHKLPLWAKGVVWYQIFPERFANGDLSNDPEAEKVFINEKKIPSGWKVKDWTSDWFAKDVWESDGNSYYERRYGGDLQGIINKLDYIKSLGVGAIYLNPVFEAVSLHKYDGSTYHHIDVNFGPAPDNDRKIISSELPDNPDYWKWTEADKLFLKLINEVHKRGMKIIIDGVFNHTGIQFWAFQDIIKNQNDSKYKDWFIINSFDDPLTAENEFDYKGWWGIKSLPEFNRNDYDLAEGPKKYIFNSTRRWMDPNGDGNPADGIDGWRLDVAREVPIGFWKQWSSLVKSINNQALIVGELWELSPDFITENGPFDALMNYNFAFAVNDFFIAKQKKSLVTEFIKRLKVIDETYPAENNFVLQNLLSSHDTERLSTMIKNPDRGYDRDANEGNKYFNPGKPNRDDYDKQKMVAAFQLFYKGAPMIYYGDEVGMWGADDPHCRKPMIWDNLNYANEIVDSSSGFALGFGNYTVEQNKELLTFYQNIINERNKHEEVLVGSCNFIYADDVSKTFAFERVMENKKTVCVFNCGESESSISFDFELKEYAIYESDNDACKNIITGHQKIILQPASFRLFYADNK